MLGYLRRQTAKPRVETLILWQITKSRNEVLIMKLQQADAEL